LLFCFALSTNSIWSQPIPCDIDNPEMTPTCAEACIICDIDGFTGRHQSNVVGSLPGDFCTFIVHNAQWIAFQAGSTSLKIKLTASNCDINYGLEMAIYKSLDCNNFEMISNCRGGGNPVSPGTSAEFTTTEPLVIGQYYYLAMDGNQGDNCDWSFEVIEGTTEIAPLTTTAPIQGVDETCPDILQLFSTAPEQGAVVFDWTLNGQPVGNNQNPEIELSFQNDGFYELCVTAKNACDVATPTCTTIEVNTITPTEIVAVFCAKDCYEADGNSYCETGTYEYAIPLADGCDSTIILYLTQLPQPNHYIDLNICEGDTFFVDNTAYFTSGQFTQTVLTDLDCDSIVHLDLNVIVCNINSQYISIPTICHGDANGEITFHIETGTPPFNFTWQHLTTGQTGSGNISLLNQEHTISNLNAGTVAIEISDNFGNFDVILAEVIEPEPILLTPGFSDYNGYNISCNRSEDGHINISPSGGILPYQYQWSTTENTQNISNLNSGLYYLSFTDDYGCEFIAEYQIEEPFPITAEVEFINPNCDGLETGMVVVDNIEGGAGGYLYSLDNSDFSDQTNFSGLGPDQYFIEIIDANGCTYQESETLVAPEIPVIIGDEIYEIELGDNVRFNVYLNNINIDSMQWFTIQELDCYDCIEPVAYPVDNDNYLLIVISLDGCSDTLNVFVGVEKNRAFYAPNAFSPNYDGLNDIFYLFGSKEVESIDLSIFDRWGGKLFESKGMNPIDGATGWDGTSRGKAAVEGVYVWMAKIHFIDNFTKVCSGDVTLLR